MGGRKKTVSDAEILRLFDGADKPFLTTTEVQAMLDFSNPGTRSRLVELEDRGYLKRRKVGQTNTWWITDAGEYYLETSDSEDEDSSG